MADLGAPGQADARKARLLARQCRSGKHKRHHARSNATQHNGSVQVGSSGTTEQLPMFREFEAAWVPIMRHHLYRNSVRHST
jgi:hypothetical protein